MNNLEVLYEDNHVIVCVKPFNILSQSDATGDIDMLSLIKEYIKKKYNKKGNVYLGLVHRLDRPVGGVMVFARTSKSASRLNDAIKNHLFSKKYLAVVHGILKKDGKFTDYLLKDEKGNTIVTEKKKGKYSELSYKVLSVNMQKKLTLVEVNLITGRHHQIRVQFASRGYPLYGDKRYGNDLDKQISLWAYSLSFLHPTTKEMKKFICYPPLNSDGFNCFDIKL